MADMIRLIPNAKHSFIAGVIVFVISIAGFLFVGGVYSNSTEARGLIDAMNPSIRTLSFAGITTVSTILALLLTILGVARRMDNDFERDFYAYIKIIGLLGITALISSTLLLLFISIPVTEAENLRAWYSAIYIILIVATSWVAGLLVSIVVTLYTTIMTLITTLMPSFESEGNDEAE